MTEQELEKDLYQVANDIGYTRESDLQTLLSITKAYAGAQVEASMARQQPIFEAAMNAKDTEIAELKADNAALVAALENMTDSGYLLNRCDESKEDDVAVVPLLSISAVQSMAKAALAANENGGVQG